MGGAGEGRVGEEMTEYERQRLTRITENKARMEALGLRGLASSLQRNSGSPNTPPGSKRKKKKWDEEQEEEYQPPDQEEEEMEEEPEETSYSSQEEERSKSRTKGKEKNASNNSKSSKIPRKSGNGKDPDFTDDDTALAHAIALSLCESVEKQKEESSHKRNTKKLNKGRIKLSETEVIAFFFSFDEVGKGYITASDIEKMAITHDFTWTDGEIAKMVHCFDSDGDRKVSLADFKSIVSQCNMLQEPGD